MRHGFHKSSNHSSFTIPSQDVGGGSVKNGERHSLARIPLRWMVRECLKLNIGIIFDAHMLKHEIGLDLKHISDAPSPLRADTHHLVKPGQSQIKGFTFSRIPVAIFSGLTLPFRWVGSKIGGLRRRPKDAKDDLFGSDLPRFEYEGEPHEELMDALSPVYDQLDAHFYWKVMEWIPCELPPSLDLHAEAMDELIRRLKGLSKSRAPRWLIQTTAGRTSLCESPSFRGISPTAGSVIDYVDCQLEPRERPPGVPFSEGAWPQSPQVGQDAHVGPRSKWGAGRLLAENPLHGERQTTTPDKGGMAGRAASPL